MDRCGVEPEGSARPTRPKGLTRALVARRWQVATSTSHGLAWPRLTSGPWRGQRALSGSAAPPVRASSDRPLAGPRAQDQDDDDSRDPPPTTTELDFTIDDERPANMNQGERASLASVRLFVKRGSALACAGLRPSPRGAPPVAPPRSRLHFPSRRFHKALEGGRAPTPTASHRASTNGERAALPPFPCQPWRRRGVRKPAH